MTAPFNYGSLAIFPEFTNRKDETEKLIQNFSNGINTILLSPRRWGKSSLVTHVAGIMDAKKEAVYRFCFIDLFNVRTEEEFYVQYATALIKATSGKWEEIVKNAGRFFKHIVPQVKISPDAINDVEFEFDWKSIKKSPDEILNLAEKISKDKKIRLIVCIDEFQNISFFNDPIGFQKKLRSHWQKHQLSAYCLYGSKRHMLMDFFTRPSMPFYKFGDIMFLEKIREEYWIPFIIQRFKDTGKRIDADQSASIARYVKNHPYFVQQLAQASWFRTTKVCTQAIIDGALNYLILQHGILFQREVDLLTNPQLNYLKAVCDGVKQYSSAKILQEYSLGTSANVLRIRAALENKEIIDTIGPEIEILDPLFEYWLKRIYFVNYHTS